MHALIRDLGRQDYLPIWEKMKAFTHARDNNTQDEFWLVEHPPVYTQGQAGKPKHFIHPTKIPIVQSDRGGQVTYHGPGQIVIYTLCQLKPINLGVRGFVSALEEAVIELLADYQVKAQSRTDAPGVYVGDAKIAALGLRVRQGCTYHGLALNVDMDLSPYQAINPCGYAGMTVTQAKDHGIDQSREELAQLLMQKLDKILYG